VNKKEKYIKNITNPILYGAAMLKMLPSLFFWGVKVKSLTEEASIVTIKHNWRNQNPFGSVYFSALNGAGELSTGVLVQMHCQGNDSYSMLVVASSAAFIKKAKGRISFFCNDGQMVKEIIDKLDVNHPSVSFTLRANAVDEVGDEVANFTFTWSVKKRL
jgi:hypothetical protein